MVVADGVAAVAVTAAPFVTAIGAEADVEAIPPEVLEATGGGAGVTDIICAG